MIVLCENSSTMAQQWAIVVLGEKMRQERQVYRRIEITFNDSDATEIRDIHDCFDMAKVLHDPRILVWVILWDVNPRIVPKDVIFKGKNEIASRRSATP